jgi:hypothetical protein
LAVGTKDVLQIFFLPERDWEEEKGEFLLNGMIPLGYDKHWTDHQKNIKIKIKHSARLPRSHTVLIQTCHSHGKIGQKFVILVKLAHFTMLQKSIPYRSAKLSDYYRSIHMPTI